MLDDEIQVERVARSSQAWANWAFLKTRVNTVLARSVMIAYGRSLDQTRRRTRRGVRRRTHPGEFRRPRSLAVPGLLSLLLLTACGGASHNHRTATTPTATPSLRPGGSSKLTQYLLKQGEGGFTVFSVAVDEPTVSDWMKSSQSTPADARRVVQEGFHDALQQETATATGGTGLNVVLELGSASAARHEETVQLREDIVEQGHVRVSRFTVAGIPDSQGISASEGARGSAANVLFTVGRCVILVGSGGVDLRFRADVTSGARALYRRTARAVGPCTSGGLLQL